jgi:hypothetical protein
MPALATAPLESALPVCRPNEAKPDRRDLRLLPSSRAATSENPPSAWILESWERALAASECALDAVVGENICPKSELVARLRRLGNERRWLARLKEIGPYDPIPPV